MKKMTMNLVAMLALAIVSLTSFAAIVGTVNVTAKVPFEFSVSGKVMPAGEYQMSSAGLNNLLVIRNFDKRMAAGAVTTHPQADNVIAQTRLEFRRYGSQYFLAKVWIKGSNEIVEFQRSSQERKAAEEFRNLAGVTAHPEIVSVSAVAAE
jgi:protein involved in polysaccharide export with SLBB domain